MSDRITDYVIKYSKVIEFDDSVFFTALDLAQDLEEAHQFFISGKSSSGLAASVIYLSGVLTGHRISQRSLEDSCKVTSYTIQVHQRGIIEELKLSGLLKKEPSSEFVEKQQRPKANCGNFGHNFYEKGNESCESCGLRVQCRRKFIKQYILTNSEEIARK